MTKRVEKGVLVLIVSVPKDAPAWLHSQYVGHSGVVLGTGSEVFGKDIIDNAHPDFGKYWVVEGAETDVNPFIDSTVYMTWHTHNLLPIDGEVDKTTRLTEETVNG